MITVRHKHMRSLGYCNRGSRLFFERYGLSWSEFLRGGIDANKLPDDAMAKRVITEAKRDGR